MPKKIIQDIYIVKKSIRMIKKSDVSDGFYSPLKKTSVTNTTANRPPVKENDIYLNEEKKRTSNDSSMFLWIICIIFIATSLFLLSSMFATATLTITPKNENVTLNDTFSIFSDKNVAGLHYQVMTIKKELSKTLETDGEEYIEKKAVGKVILYNKFSTGNQRLIINTRLETKSGLIYKTRVSVNVPGMKKDGTPGSAEVEIIADMPGDKYNMKLSDLKGDFTIPGFKGSAKYTSFYGRLSADTTGGFIGNIKKVSDESIATVRAELKTALQADLIKEVYAKKPEQYVLFKNNHYMSCNDLPYDPTNREYKISEECTVNAIIFHKEELSSYVAKNKIKDFDNSKVDIMWNDNNTITLTGSTEKPWTENTLKVKFTGSALVVWSYDPSEIIGSIVGQDKSIIRLIIENNKNSLKEIQANIRPMWKNTFPEKQTKIKIIDTIRDNTQ